jgi:hypothetical protein
LQGQNENDTVAIAIGGELFSRQCEKDDFGEYYFFCNVSTQTANISCNGNEEFKTVQCPTLYQHLLCGNVYNKADEWSSLLQLCTTVSFTKDNVTCNCQLSSIETSSLTTNSILHSHFHFQRITLNTNYTGNDVVKVSYVGLLETVGSNMKTTVLSASDLNAQKIERSSIAIATVGCLIACICIALYYAQRLDEEDQQSLKEKHPLSKNMIKNKASIVPFNEDHQDEDEKEDEKNQKGHKRLSSMPINRLLGSFVTSNNRSFLSTKSNRKSTRTREYLHRQQHIHHQPNRSANETLFLLAEEALPDILMSSKSWMRKMSDEMKRHHRWFAVIFYYSVKLPRILRVVSLSTQLIMMLFVQSITYNFTKGDDGTCATYTSEMTCLAPRSYYAPGSSKCYWTSDITVSHGGYCEYVEPANQLKVIIFVAIFSALLSTPIALTVDWMVQNILAAPTKLAVDLTVLQQLLNYQQFQPADILPTNQPPIDDDVEANYSMTNQTTHMNMNTATTVAATPTAVKTQVVSLAVRPSSHTHPSSSFVPQNHRKTQLQKHLDEIVDQELTTLIHDVKAYYQQISNIEEKRVYQCK